MWLKPKMFLFCFTKILNQAFLHDSHIWFWGFLTFLFALAHGALLSSQKLVRPSTTYLFRWAIALLDNISVTEAVLFFIFNTTAEVKNTSKILLVMITSTAKNPSHEYFPKLLSKWQYFFFREYPPGVK